eukprot:CAMPEP_0198494296 /NCGR_PEP_ID=MMETSP1462-20131121/4567_1 /TAXON_ID=1333877 /ORGANISM="Brandtodinium nutriculum, Strain RCC3387" /LENGTH=126 /DNA_ID=CAMNT_0044223035 /DNA_START=59 /DNA_END=437 /DNA_ORIENTATION=+
MALRAWGEPQPGEEAQRESRATFMTCALHAAESPPDRDCTIGDAPRVRILRQRQRGSKTKKRDRPPWALGVHAPLPEDSAVGTGGRLALHAVATRAALAAVAARRQTRDVRGRRGGALVAVGPAVG